MTIYIPETQAPITESIDYPKLKAGTYPCRIFSVIDLGTQQNPLFKKDDGTPQDPARQIHIGFETVDELDESGKPFRISKEYSYKISSEKSTKISGLTTLIEAVNGNRDDKNVFRLIGKLALVSATTNESGWAKVTAVTGLPKVYADKEYPAYNDLKIFFIDEFDKFESVFDTLPEYLTKKITASPEYKTIVLGQDLE
jgi:hypothetical protein